jgi:hypothetical protein
MYTVITGMYKLIGASRLFCAVMVYHMVIGQGLLVLFTEKNQHMLVRTIATFLAAIMGTASSKL